MATIQERIKERRNSLGLTLLEIAELLNVKEATVQRYESGEIKNIKHETVVELAKILKCTPQYLMGWTEQVNEIEISPLSTDKIFLIPIYDSVAAGFGAIAQDCVVSYLPTYLACPSEKDSYLWVNVKGDSMAPLIDDGSKILIKKQTSVDSGNIAVVLVDNEEAVVKKVIYGDTWVELHSTNPYYPPRRFENSDLERIQILGLVKEVSKSL